ncbi:MAG: hypothetical protein GX493_01050 [Firmicutes bacterium]|nr:hypothetical protein [Bacillota bacterium]
MGTGRVYGADLAWQGVPLGLGEVVFTVTKGRIMLRKAHLLGPGGEAELTGAIDLAARRTMDLAGRFAFTAEGWGRFLTGEARPTGRLTGTARLTGTVAAPEIAAVLDMDSGSLYGFSWETLDATVRWREGRLYVREAVARKAGTTLTLKGKVAREGYTLTAALQAANLHEFLPSLSFGLPPVLQELSGRLTLEAEIGGSLAHPLVTGRVIIDHPTWREWRCTRITGYFTFDRERLFLPQLAATSGERSYSLHGSVDLSRRQMALDFGVTQGDLAGLLSLLEHPLPWPVAGRLEGRGRIGGSFDRPEVEGSFRLTEGKLAGFAFTGEVTGRYDGDGVTCDRLRLNYEGGSLTGVGRLAPEEIALNVTADGLPLAEISRLAGHPGRVEGRTALRISFRRTPGSVAGDLTLSATELKVAGLDLDRAVLEARLQDRLVSISRAEFVAGGTPLHLSGTIPLPEEIAPSGSFWRDLAAGQGELALRLEGKAVPAKVFNPVFRNLLFMQAGEVDVAMEVSGTWMKPNLRGSLRLQEGAGRSAFLPEPFSHCSLDLLFTDDRVLVREAGVRIGRGWAQLGGTVRLGPGGPDYALTLKGGRIAYKNPAFFDGELTGLDLAIVGKGLPAVRGTITVSQSSITVGTSRHGPPPPALPLDVRLMAGRNTRFYLPGILDASLNGEVRLQGTMAAPALAGVLRASLGTFFLYGQRFTIVSATGTFLPERGYLPYVEIEGQKTIGRTRVFVRVTGEVTEAGLRIELWSEPELGRDEILSLLTGRGSSAGVDAPRLFATGMEFVLDTVFGQLGEDVKRFMDVDRFQISFDEDVGAFRLQLGKSFSERFYLSYEILFDEFGTRVWSFDYRFNRFLVFHGVFSSTTEPEWTLSYQWKF